MNIDRISLERIELLHPVIRYEVKALFIKSQELLPDNIILRITQGLRTIEQQNKLYAQGRTTKGNIVTNAKGGSSYHNYGLAFDLCYIINGKAVWRVDDDYKKIVQLFKGSGYTWGGDFKSIVDNPHFEKTFGYNWKALSDKYNKNQFITGTKYVTV